MTDEQIKYMTERFLTWKLPVAEMSPDGGIGIKRPNYAPVGTNLLDYTQAEAMVRHLVDGMPG